MTLEQLQVASANANSFCGKTLGYPKSNMTFLHGYIEKLEEAGVEVRNQAARATQKGISAYHEQVALLLFDLSCVWIREAPPPTNTHTYTPPFLILHIHCFYFVLPFAAKQHRRSHIQLRYQPCPR